MRLGDYSQRLLWKFERRYGLSAGNAGIPYSKSNSLTDENLDLSDLTYIWTEFKERLSSVLLGCLDGGVF